MPARRQPLQLSWYQDGGDPFLHLAAILATLDFTMYCVSDFAPLRRGPLKKVAFGMRPMNDKTGLPLKVESVSADDAYAGMLEGSPYMARRFRRMQGGRIMARPGTYVDGLDALDREIAQLTHQCDIWAPEERWTARGVTETQWASQVRH